jgi:hypothetical protein
VATADATMAMAGCVSLGGRRGPVIVAAAVPVSRCGVVSDEVAGLGAFHVLTSWVLYYPGSLSPKQPLHIPFGRGGGERVSCVVVGKK